MEQFPKSCHILTTHESEMHVADKGTVTRFFKVKQVSQILTSIQMYFDNEHRPHNKQYP